MLVYDSANNNNIIHTVPPPVLILLILISTPYLYAATCTRGGNYKKEIKNCSHFSFTMAHSDHFTVSQVKI